MVDQPLGALEDRAGLSPAQVFELLETQQRLANADNAVDQPELALRPPGKTSFDVIEHRVQCLLDVTVKVVSDRDGMNDNLRVDVCLSPLLRRRASDERGAAHQ